MDKVVLVAVSLGAFKAQPLKTVCARSVSAAPTSYSVIKASIKLLLKEPILRQKNAPNAFPEAVKWKATKVGILRLRSANTMLANPAHIARKKAVSWRATVEDTLLSDNLSTRKT